MTAGLIRLGARGAPPSTPTVVTRLVECHERIRRFLAIAERLATTDASPDERRAAAQSLVRYFAHALPLHIADEEQSLAPRLRMIAAAAPAIATMITEHDAMDPLLATLCRAWQTIADEPHDETRRTQTITAVQALSALMLPHLSEEERDVFPHLAALSPEDQAAIVAEMEARRVT